MPAAKARAGNAKNYPHSSMSNDDVECQRRQANVDMFNSIEVLTDEWRRELSQWPY